MHEHGNEEIAGAHDNKKNSKLQWRPQINE